MREKKMCYMLNREFGVFLNGENYHICQVKLQVSPQSEKYIEITSQAKMWVIPRKYKFVSSYLST